MDAVSDRDFVIEFGACAALIMSHLSRWSEELVLWSSPQFDFIELGDAFCTGSSIMPQKKNPDVPELVRGKTGRIYGHLLALLTLMKAQPLAYNKDNQEDKEPLFDTVDTLKACLRAYIGMIPALQIKRDKLRQAAGRGFRSTASALAVGHRSGRLSGAQRSAFPQCARHRGPRRARGARAGQGACPVVA